jgi:SAM-dependent methyltransferase
MRQALKRYYLAQMARPSALGMLVNPFYFARRALFDEVRAFAGHIRGRVLDVGCGQRPYENLFSADEYVGLELDSPAARARDRADIYYEGAALPFAPDSFDALLCNQVFEHVFNPELFLAELHRVLKPGGKLLLTVPFAWDEHEQPGDFARYSSFGIAASLRRAGFEILEQRKTAADARAVFQICNAYLFKITSSGGVYRDLAFAVLLMAPVNLIGALLSRLLPSNPDFYLDNVVLAIKSARQ